MRRNKEAHHFVIGVILFGAVFMILAISFPLPDLAFGQDLIIYPNKGQSAKQQEKDKYECYSWAKGQSGFDPMATPKATAPPPEQEAPQGGVVRGGARGALGGLAIGAIAGDAGKGAAIGAASGALIGGLRRREQVAREEQRQEQWANQQMANYQQGRANYNRAFSACLEGRGYTVK
ncbi:MAG: glycine zipper domain-containing protein [Thermodesulfobacteriota bacterium]|nr:glycine zipper domain-containing protein [Thermodesulfobacteriota bacterium]